MPGYCLAGKVARTDDNVGAVERTDDCRRERRIVLTIGIDGENRGRALVSTQHRIPHAAPRLYRGSGRTRSSRLP